MGRRGRTPTVAAIVAGAGVVAVAVVVLAGDVGQRLPTVGGEGSGTLTLEPELVEPRTPGATRSPGVPAPTSAPSKVAGVPGAVVEGSPGPVVTAAPAAGVGVDVGSVGGLYPGHRVELEVTYVNPYAFPIAIDRVDLSATGTAACGSRQLRAVPHPRLRIPSGSSVASTIEVGMRRSAPNACQGMRFVVGVGVSAVKL